LGILIMLQRGEDAEHLLFALGECHPLRYALV